MSNEIDFEVDHIPGGVLLDSGRVVRELVAFAEIQIASFRPGAILDGNGILDLAQVSHWKRRFPKARTGPVLSER